ncbi:MAG: hypothetical protein NT154_39520 [Verrucomicrobia bacterium]|nr:hypothetical protein [Verrucomicrobiota bacterium]
MNAEAMIEFKFACPVCGQHITADSTTAGGQIECPTCFQQIVVPQAPESGGTKLILSAALVAKPRPTSADTASQMGPIRRSSPWMSLLPLAALLVFLGAGGAAVFHFRGWILKSLRPAATASTNTVMPKPVPPPLNTTYPVPTNIRWTLGLSNANFPNTTAAGRIHGSGFFCEKAFLRGGLLTLDQGKAWPWDLGLAVHLFAHRGEELSDKTFEISPDRLRPPRVFLRWKDALQQPVVETFTNGYLLKVAFGHATNEHLFGKIYICLLDADKSFVAGTFDAEIRKSSPPKAGSPKTSKLKD